MTQLNQLLAVSKGAKKESGSAIANAYQQIQKSAMFDGLVRTYEPLDDDGERFPSESKKVVLKADVIIKSVHQAFARMLDVTCEIDVTNAKARADVTVDGQVILTNMPAVHLISLEKQLVDLATFVSKLPILDPAHDWRWDEANNCWRTEDIQTARQKKVQKPLTMAKATEKHAEQVVLITEDVLAGYWTTAKLSGAVPQSTVIKLLGRISKLSSAVKQAREQANMVQVEGAQSSPLLDYLFEDFQA